MKSATLTIDQMHCQNCVTKVTTALKAVSGAEIKQVTIGSAEVAFDPAKTTPQGLVQAVSSAGFPARIAKIGK